MCLANHNSFYGSTYNSSAIMSADTLNKFRTLVIARVCPTGISVIPMGVSFVLSMVYLKRAKNRAASTNASTDEHKHASATVIIVTFLYLICNCPMFVYAAYSIYLQSQFPSSQDEISFLEFECIFYPTYFDKYYARLMLLSALPAINSTLNPVIYFWRMKPFRRFILRGDGAG